MGRIDGLRLALKTGASTTAATTYRFCDSRAHTGDQFLWTIHQKYAGLIAPGEQQRPGVARIPCCIGNPFEQSEVRFGPV